MNENLHDSKLITEEMKSTTLFICIFNLIFVAYEIMYYYIFPSYYGKPVGLPDGILGFWYYGLVAFLLAITLYVVKKYNVYLGKYILFFGFTFIDMLNNFYIYYGEEKHFRSGNLVEIIFIMFAPLFVDKKFFWYVFSGMIIKYALSGILFKDPSVIIPIGMFILITSVAYILLNRFAAYVKAINNAHEEARQKEKLVLMGRMATAIGHEIKNPLASLRGLTQLQQENYPNQTGYYPIMIQEIDRINSIVSDLMMIGKPRVSNFEKHDLQAIIIYVNSIISGQAKQKGIEIETKISSSLVNIECDDKQIKQVLINLIKNAIESMDDGGKISIEAVLLPTNEILISIQDEGCGISEEDLKRLGEPFFTTKTDGNGLGIMVSKHIILDHKGKLKIESAVGKGTLMMIVLPVHS